MSLRNRLTLLIVLLLGLGLGLAVGLAAWQAAQQLRTELSAALLVGVQTVRDDSAARDAPDRLAGLVAEFNGDRHLQAVLLGTDGEVLRASTLASGGDPVPAWFARLVGRGPPAVLVRQGGGTVLLRADPANELLEVWGTLREEVLGFAVFCVPVVVLVHLTLRIALRPLADIADGLARIEAGRRDVRVPARGPPELAGLARGFNRMSGRLDDVDARNTGLVEQMLTLQEEERADLARDLHDEVGPALFAVTMTTATILRLLHGADPRAASAPGGATAVAASGPEGWGIAGSGAAGPGTVATGTAAGAGRGDTAPLSGVAGLAASEIAGEVRLIQDSIGHVQRHVRDILGRLRPLRAAEFGLAVAVGELAAFWRARDPSLAITVAVDLGHRPAEAVEETLYRVVQEGLSNAMRHARPTRVDVALRDDGTGTTTARVWNDSTAPVPGLAARGSGRGLAGMRERVAALSGTLAAGPARDGGWLVAASLPSARAPQAGAGPSGDRGQGVGDGQGAGAGQGAGHGQVAHRGQGGGIGQAAAGAAGDASVLALHPAGAS